MSEIEQIRRREGFAFFAAFAATVPLANWLIGNVGTFCVPNGPCVIPVGFGYRLVIPVGAYYTWHDNNLEGQGVAPDVEEPVSPDALWKGEDNQLKRAVECVTGRAAIAVH